MYLDIAEKINTLAEEDQRLRNNIPTEPELAKELWIKIDKADLISTNYLKKVVNQIGLPSISKVGRKASSNAWLLVQHSQDLEFQKLYLKLMKENREDVNAVNIAYLDDRVLMRQGKPQIYGTQLVQDEKTKLFKPFTLKDPEKVNVLRSDVGLETIEEYLEEINS